MAMDTEEEPTSYNRIVLNAITYDLPSHYVDAQPIGIGAYGSVVLVNDACTEIYQNSKRYHSDRSSLDMRRNVKVAIKKLSRPFQTAIHAKRTYREVMLLKHMRHENVIGLLDIFAPNSHRISHPCQLQEVYLVSDLLGADLNQIVKSQPLSEDHVKFLLYQLLRGLKYIHSVGIIHRDLKPSNIAVNEECELKILGKSV